MYHFKCINVKFVKHRLLICLLSDFKNIPFKNLFSWHIRCINSIQELSIKIKNINERPYGMTLSGSHTVLANGTAGYSIGEVTVLDPDVEQTHVISIKGPNSDFIKAIYLPIPVNLFK